MLLLLSTSLVFKSADSSLRALLGIGGNGNGRASRIQYQAVFITS